MKYLCRFIILFVSKNEILLYFSENKIFNTLQACEPEVCLAFSDNSLTEDKCKTIKVLSDLYERQLVGVVDWAKQIPGNKVYTRLERRYSDSPPKLTTLFLDFEMTSILLVIKISWIWRDFKLYFVILNFLDRTTREGGKSEYLLLGPSYMVFTLIYNSRLYIAYFRGFCSKVIIQSHVIIYLFFGDFIFLH